MDIKRNIVERITIEEFADKHSLTMEVNERPAWFKDDSRRFYASFDGAEVGDGRFLTGAFGDGRTEEDAIAAYGVEITGKTIVMGAYTDKRREITVPIIVGVT